MTASSNPHHTDPSINSAVRRDPEDRPAQSEDEQREKMMDKTLADSFPTSDPPSSIPDPSDPAVEGCGGRANRSELFEGLTPGTWVALSLDACQIVGVGATRDDAEQAARSGGHLNFSLDEVPADADAPLQAPDDDDLTPEGR